MLILNDPLVVNKAPGDEPLYMGFNICLNLKIEKVKELKKEIFSSKEK